MTPKQQNDKIRDEYRTRHPEHDKNQVLVTYTCTGPDADTIDGHIVRAVDSGFSTLHEERVKY